MNYSNLSKWWVCGAVAMLATACVVQESSDKASTGGAGGTAATGGAGGATAGTGGTVGGAGGATAGTGGTGGAVGGTGGATAGTGGTGGATAGTGGTGGTGGSEPAPYVEDCDDASATFGIERSSAVPLSRAEICTASGTEHWFSVTTPDTGGAHVVELSLVQSADARVRVVAFAGADNSQIGSVTLAQGVSRSVYLTLGSSTVTYLQVERYSGEGPVEIQLTRTPEADVYEPNNTRAAAKPIELDTDIIGQTIIPYVSDVDRNPDDWFSVELAAGAEASLSLTQVPDNVRYRIAVVDSAGVNVGSSVAPNVGALLTHRFTPGAAGTYYVNLELYSATDGGPFITVSRPSHLTDSYTLRAAQ